MSDRLSDVEARIHTVRQLSSVITAMRGIAAARSREARSRLEGVRAYAGTIAAAIGQVLASPPEAERQQSAPNRRVSHAIVALCAEQGFAGVFSERVLDGAVRLSDGGGEFMLVGDRGLTVAAERKLEISWSTPMVAHADQAIGLADRIVEALYRRLDDGGLGRVTLVHAVPTTTNEIQVVEAQLIPFDFDRFPPQANPSPPLLTLPPQALLARLAQEYVFAEICEAIILSYAAENEARMRAMIAARTHVADKLDELVARSRQLRQDEITSEIIELVSGASVTRTPAKACA